MDNLNDDWRAFLSLMISHRVKFLLLGGHAIAVHAVPRMTEDLDVGLDCGTSSENVGGARSLETSSCGRSKHGRRPPSPTP